MRSGVWKLRHTLRSGASDGWLPRRLRFLSPADGARAGTLELPYYRPPAGAGPCGGSWEVTEGGADAAAGGSAAFSARWVIECPCSVPPSAAASAAAPAAAEGAASGSAVGSAATQQPECGECGERGVHLEYEGLSDGERVAGTVVDRLSGETLGEPAATTPRREAPSALA